MIAFLGNTLTSLFASTQTGPSVNGFSTLLSLGASRVPKLSNGQIYQRPVASMSPVNYSSGFPRRFFLSSMLASMMMTTMAAAVEGEGAPLPPGGVPRLLNQEEAINLDVELMSVPGFSIDQLMELAGLSCAAALHRAYPDQRRVLIVCGPGNNGGDGLVAARHLYHFGYEPTVVYPKPGRAPLFANLVHQARDLGIPVLPALPEDPDGSFDVVMDAVFGFSFKGKPRAPFDAVINYFVNTKLPVMSVDIPSGWDVEGGDVHGTGFRPVALVSLTAPKRMAAGFEGRHFLGGRFLPPGLAQKYELNGLPKYLGAEQIVELPSPANPTCAVEDEQRKQHLEQSDEFVVTWITAPNEDEATTLAGKLVEGKMAACVNLIPGIKSIYSWKGNIEKDSEVLMMVKTRKSLLKGVTEFIASEHSYEVPETIAAQIIGGNSAYLKWLKDNTKGEL
uniref:NAD(P)H-hydrate epimerase n=1 Tax=Heterosigma akashiwo TaxID=2829 RepID=A0A6S9JPG5_HETAK